MIDISKYKIIPRKGLGCFESCIVSAAEYYIGNCSMAFCETFQFQYNKKKRKYLLLRTINRCLKGLKLNGRGIRFKGNKIGDRILIRSNNILDYLQTLYGIGIKSYPQKIDKAGLCAVFLKDNTMHLITITSLEENTYRVCELLMKWFPHSEMVRFGLSGTEVIQNTFRLARAFTGRQIVIRFMGHFHGTADDVLGNEQNLPDNTPDPFSYDTSFHTEGRREDSLNQMLILV